MQAKEFRYYNEKLGKRDKFRYNNENNIINKLYIKILYKKLCEQPCAGVLGPSEVQPSNPQSQQAALPTTRRMTMERYFVHRDGQRAKRLAIGRYLGAPRRTKDPTKARAKQALMPAACILLLLTLGASTAAFVGANAIVRYRPIPSDINEKTKEGTKSLIKKQGKGRATKYLLND